MIYVDRKSVAKPKVLSGKSQAGAKETAKNKKLANKAIWDKLVFKVYSSKEVKESLIKLFHGKCAYCESSFLNTYPGDVEHFRPKGGITEAPPNTPGYYWLAADWDNLLLSCRNCNQNLTHLVYGTPPKMMTLGKMNQFPLMTGCFHIQSHTKYANLITQEENERLLINPCKENPENYFTYDINGVIMSKYNTGKHREMAEKSIHVYALRRMPLVQAREKLSIEIHAQMQRVIEAFQQLDNCMDANSINNNQVILYDKILKRELTYLTAYKEDNKEFAGMARQIIDEFMKNVFGI